LNPEAFESKNVATNAPPCGHETAGAPRRRRRPKSSGTGAPPGWSSKGASLVRR